MSEREMYQPDKEKLEEFMLKFADLVNGGLSSSIPQKAMVEILNYKTKHRTLQASIFRIVLSIVAGMASDELGTDGRNQHAHEQAKRMIKGFGIVLADEEYNRVLRDTADEHFAKQKRENFLKFYNENPANYLGVAFI